MMCRHSSRRMRSGKSADGYGLRGLWHGTDAKRKREKFKIYALSDGKQRNTVTNNNTTAVGRDRYTVGEGSAVRSWKKNADRRPSGERQ